MQQGVNNTIYPVKNIWILKATMESYASSFAIGLIGLACFGVVDILYKALAMTYLGIFGCLVLFLVVFPISLISCALKKRNFHYEFEENIITVSQGIFDKQKVSIPYSTLQNVVVRQRFWDRIFKIYSLAIQNVVSPDSNQDIIEIVDFKEQIGQNLYIELIGLKGNTLNIPGLKQAQAETLKRIILEKMKKNKSESKSGL